MSPPRFTQQISVSEFNADYTEEIRAVEKGDLLIGLIHPGKKVALPKSPDAGVLTPDPASCIDSGQWTVAYGVNYGPAAPG